MNKTLKTGLLLTILGAPVLIFLFGKIFGSHHFEVARFPGKEKYLKDEAGNIRNVPDFSFSDQEGNSFTRAQMQGKVAIVDFIFSRCEGICPKMTSQLSRVQDSFLEQKDVILVSHTVDPEFDSVGILNNYAKEYGAKYGHWYFLTGKKDALYSIARNGYFLPVGKGDGGPADFIHSEKVVLVDRKGRIRGFYGGTDPLQIDTLITEARVLLQEPD
jgi:protein SCO1